MKKTDFEVFDALDIDGTSASISQNAGTEDRYVFTHHNGVL